MASITIRNLDDDVKTRLRVRAAENHRSMEEEVRIILRDTVSGDRTGLRNLAAFTTGSASRPSTSTGVSWLRTAHQPSNMHASEFSNQSSWHGSICSNPSHTRDRR